MKILIPLVFAACALADTKIASNQIVAPTVVNLTITENITKVPLPPGTGATIPQNYPTGVVGGCQKPFVFRNGLKQYRADQVPAGREDYSVSADGLSITFVKPVVVADDVIDVTCFK